MDPVTRKKETLQVEQDPLKAENAEFEWDPSFRRAITAPLPPLPGSQIALLPLAVGEQAGPFKVVAKLYNSQEFCQYRVQDTQENPAVLLQFHSQGAAWLDTLAEHKPPGFEHWQQVFEDGGNWFLAMADIDGVPWQEWPFPANETLLVNMLLGAARFLEGCLAQNISVASLQSRFLHISPDFELRYCGLPFQQESQAPEKAYDLYLELQQAILGQLWTEEGLPVSAELGYVFKRFPSLPQTVGAAGLLPEIQTLLAPFSGQVELKVAACGKTDVGRKRQLNEDSVGLFSHSLLTGDEEVEFQLILVADGMGGHEGGEVASQMALKTMHIYLLTHLTAEVLLDNTLTRQCLQAALEHTNREILALGQQERFQAKKPPGTTMTCALLVNPLLFIGHVGDSRCYCLREQHLELLTSDHSLAQIKIDRGEMTEEEAFDWKKSNIIYSCLGMEKLPRQDVLLHHMLPGDVFLLCSDGLSGMLRRNYLQSLMNAGREQSLEQLADELIGRANSEGGKDNISVVLLQVARK